VVGVSQYRSCRALLGLLFIAAVSSTARAKLEIREAERHGFRRDPDDGVGRPPVFSRRSA
jgi:hypothetical protein